MKKIKFLALLCWAVLFFTSCKKEDAKPDCDCNNAVVATGELELKLRTNGNVYKEWYFQYHYDNGPVTAYYKICNEDAFKTMLANAQIQPNDETILKCNIEQKERCNDFVPANISYGFCNVLNISPK